MSLSDWLIRILGSGAAGILGSTLQTYLEVKWPWMGGWDRWAKRAFAWLVACGLASGAYYLLVWLGTVAMPVTAQAHVEALFPFWFLAVTASQGAHAAQR